jgi:hypothetical protein
MVVNKKKALPLLLAHPPTSKDSLFSVIGTPPFIGAGRNAL